MTKNSSLNIPDKFSYKIVYWKYAILFQFYYYSTTKVSKRFFLVSVRLKTLNDNFRERRLRSIVSFIRAEFLLETSLQLLSDTEKSGKASLGLI